MTTRALSRARLARARKTQWIIAAYWQRWWPHAEPVWGSQAGRDVISMPGLAPEIKATSDVPLLDALKQAARNAGDDLPLVVWRPNGYGAERVEEWVMAFTVKDGTRLLLAAGYGTEPKPPPVHRPAFDHEGRCVCGHLDTFHIGSKRRCQQCLECEKDDQ